MEFGKSEWRNFEEGIRKEWLLTNGIGGFAASTVIGANTRRYHGLLIASLKPPVMRHLILSSLDEAFVRDGKTYNLNSFQTGDGYIMKGYHHLQRAVVNTLPTFLYNVGDTFIEKKLCMVYGENTTVITYRILNGARDGVLKITPLVNFRDYHHTSSKPYLNFTQKPYEDGIIIKPSYYDIDINLYCSEGSFVRYENTYFYNMFYAVERERGLDSNEDHYIPGCFEINIKPFEEKLLSVICTVEKELTNKNGMELILKENERLEALVEKSGFKDEIAKRLTIAADNFIVSRKSTEAKTIIAGYPWFTDWGRDTMIALPGLTLATRRFEDAKEILYTFAKYIKYGLVPNVFPDGDHEPAYNSVDAALWYFEAANKYISYTRDFEFVLKSIYPVLKQIIHSFSEGTLYNIKMDKKDGLINAGDMGTQLTWMDAKIGDWVVTPRHGKAVEISALWYNALMVMAVLAKEAKEDGTEYELLAQKVKESFAKSFWNEEKQCLYDVITGENKDERIRPNQIMAVSLSYPVLEGEKAAKVVGKVFEELYTAYGLRSLSPTASEYSGVYIGDQFSRDSAYHQGTVWTWPLGQFITAFIKVNDYSNESRERARLFIQPFYDHFRDSCIGNISEIFDGNEPLVPRGCFAQAWSVAEILRAYSEDVMPKD